MPDENDTGTAGQDASQGNNQQQGSDSSVDDFDVSGLSSEAQGYIHSLTVKIAELKNESAGRRRKGNELTEQLAALQNAQNKQLEESGNFKELASRRAAEIAAMQPFKDMAERLEKSIRASNEAVIETIPEDRRSLIPAEYSPEQLQAYLVANKDTLRKAPAPNIDAGASGGTGSASVKLTAEELKIAAATGITPEDYAKNKARMTGTA